MFVLLLEMNNMARTIRWYHILGKFYNPQWFRHELKCIRIKLHQRFRHKNKVTIKKGLDIELEPKTRGWETY